MRILGLKSRAKKAAHWLKSRFVESALILGYHRVAEVARDPYELCVTPQHFAEQLEVLRRYAYPINLQELVQGLQDGNLPRKAVALTLDDGYADNLYHAKPLLERYQIPATIFVTTGYFGREFWWDELERMLLHSATLPEKLFLPIHGGTYEWVSGNTAHITLKEGVPSLRQHLLWSLYQLLLPLPSAEREKAMAQLWAWTGTKSNDRSHYRALTADELIELADGDLVEIGAHTATHPVLTELPVEAQRAEIQQSKLHLTELLGRPVTSFSYPNGASSEETLTIVQEFGFFCACASFHDVAWRRSNRFHLPRFWIQDWDGAMFSRWLRRWLHS